jgi:hypothetical protein
MLDGEHLAERCVVVALAILADGTKKPVGLWEGSTENKTVVRALLADLVERGLCCDDGLLVVLDGAKALSAAVREVFGDKALIQRCTLHKRRNVADHLPDKEQAWVDAKLVKAFTHPDPDQGLRRAKDLAGLLANGYPGAAASLLEGLEEMFTPRPPRCRRPPGQDLDHVEPGRVDDLHRPLHQPQRHSPARRTDAAALDRGRHAQRRTIVPPHQGLQADAPTHRRATPTRPPQPRGAETVGAAA